MEVLKELEALAHYTFAFLEIQLVLKVEDPGVRAGATDENITALLQVAWP